MSKALVIKELRETGWIVLLAAGAFAYVWMGLTGHGFLTGSTQRVETIPFADGQFLGEFEWTVAVFAVVLGLRQSAWETLRGTSVFLLWRPVARGRIFAIKLALGLGLLLGTSGLAILAYRAVGGPSGHACQSLLLVDGDRHRRDVAGDDHGLFGRICRGNPAGPDLSAAALSR